MSLHMHLQCDLAAYRAKCPRPPAWQHGLRTPTSSCGGATAASARVHPARKQLISRRMPHQVRAVKKESQLTAPRATPSRGEQQGTEPEQGGSNTPSSIAGLLLWAGFVGYAFLASPNQTPYRDMYFLEKLSGLGADDGVAINAVFTQLFFIMGLWPAIYAALLIPSARSATKLPAWPFVAASFGVGIFALGPYFALWAPSREAKSPPAPEELQGWRALGLKGTESRVGAWLILAGVIATIGQAALAGAASWQEYGKLFLESRFVHVTSTDFAALSLFAPFWMWNDAEKRGWESRQRLLPVLSVLPVLGPAIYLVLRPKASA